MNRENSQVSNEQIYELLLEIRDEQKFTRQAIGELTKDVKEIKEDLNNVKQRLEVIEDKLDTTKQNTEYLALDTLSIKNKIKER